MMIVNDQTYTFKDFSCSLQFRSLITLNKAINILKPNLTTVREFENTNTTLVNTECFLIATMLFQIGGVVQHILFMNY